MGEKFLSSLFHWQQKLLAKSLIFFISCYQRILSPWLGPNCRFFPTCSHYAIVCLQRYGILRATGKILMRILKCNPWHRGGEDLP